MILLDPLARPVIAHRGASGEWPENTLLAFTRGLEQGADAIEFDVRLAADGTPVIIHDATVDRTTDGSGRVREIGMEALRRLDAGQGERIPALAEVLDAFPATPVIIELKEPAAAEPVRELLRHHAAQHRALVGAFASAALRPFGTEFARSASRPEVARFLVAARLGFPPFRTAYQAFTVPETSGALTVVDQRFARRARRLGLPIHVWTVDDVTAAARLRGLGVAGIITNYPARFRETRTTGRS